MPDAINFKTYRKNNNLPVDPYSLQGGDFQNRNINVPDRAADQPIDTRIDQGGLVDTPPTRPDVEPTGMDLGGPDFDLSQDRFGLMNRFQRPMKVPKRELPPPGGVPPATRDSVFTQAPPEEPTGQPVVLTDEPAMGAPAAEAPPPTEPMALPDVMQDTGVQEAGEGAFGQYTKYAMGDEDPMVTAERQRMERNNLLRTEQAKRTAHERAVNAGYRPGTPQYEQMMRGAVTDAHNQNIQAENNLNDFARARRSERQAELMNIYEKGVQADESAWERFEDVSKFLPSLKAQEQAMMAQLGGVSLSATIQGMYGPDGTLKSEYKDLTQAQLVKQGIKDAVREMANSPDGNPWKSGEQDKYIETFYQENFENILYPSEGAAKEREEEQTSDKRIEDYIKTGDTSKMQDSDYARMDAAQLEQAGVPTFTGGETFLRVEDFTKSDLKADVVESSVDDKARKREPGSAGKGNGSIIVWNGKAYRITRYWSKKDTTGKDERNGRLYAVPLAGGEEELISESGWTKLT